jgi:FlaA1/EpsC-like NDP-sugar epimerase
VDRWGELFREQNSDGRSSARNSANASRTVLVTGAGGCIGSALAKTIALANPRLLILLDHSEENLYRIHSELESRSMSFPHVPVLGSISDRRLLAEIFSEHSPEIVYHAVAYKHVPLMETNPLAVLRNNVFGTQTVVQMAVEFEVSHFIMISTDKAVNPQSVMGVSKRIAELLLLGSGTDRTRLSAVRFGNVFGSNGSVVPRFTRQIECGGPVTVTHPDAVRYFLTLPEAVEIILAAASSKGSGLFIPELREPVKILDLAKCMIAAASKNSAEPIGIIFTGLRPGEKMSEQLLSSDESVVPTSDALLNCVNRPKLRNDKLEITLERLLASIRARDLVAVMDIVEELVPGYTPSEAVLAMMKPSLA